MNELMTDIVFYLLPSVRNYEYLPSPGSELVLQGEMLRKENLLVVIVVVSCTEVRLQRKCPGNDTLRTSNVKVP